MLTYVASLSVGLIQAGREIKIDGCDAGEERLRNDAERKLGKRNGRLAVLAANDLNFDREQVVSQFAPSAAPRSQAAKLRNRE